MRHAYTTLNQRWRRSRMNPHRGWLFLA
jgi:hypothetical protein